MNAIWHICVMKLSLVTLNHSDFPHLNPLSLHRLDAVKKKFEKIEL